MIHVFFETETHISELIVNQPYFAPYRYVSFMVMDIKQELPEPVFSIMIMTCALPVIL